MIDWTLSNTVCGNRICKKRGSCRTATYTFSSIISSIKVWLAIRYTKPAIVLSIQGWHSGASTDTHVCGRVSIHIGSGCARQHTYVVIGVPIWAKGAECNASPSVILSKGSIWACSHASFVRPIGIIINRATIYAHSVSTYTVIVAILHTRTNIHTSSIPIIGKWTWGTLRNAKSAYIFSISRGGWTCEITYLIVTKQIRSLWTFCHTRLCCVVN